jgi:hydroxymethylpyrimidine pyrophosphatase-like HAD family hydrolase
MNPTFPIRALACDYDETLAREGRVDASTVEALVRLKASGVKLLLVTGRQLGDLLSVCMEIRLFDRVVAENGALLYRPAARETSPLAGRPPKHFLERLREQKVKPLSAGRSIVATVEEFAPVVEKTIAEMGLNLQMIFNRESLMILPRDVNKATGLKAALSELRVPAGAVVGIGDAENDDAFLKLCGIYVAVANAIPSIRAAADLITEEDRGAGVVEVINKVMAGDLSGVQASR